MILSVIVPAFNCEKYISDCLDSLTKQGFDDNYEVLVIDDGSTDSTGEIVNKYCEKYYFIKLIRKDNGGVSSARNLGINNAKGKYVVFIDADDYISPNVYLPIIEIIEGQGFSSMYFGFTSEKGKVDVFDKSFYVVKKENACKAAVWRMVYSKEIIDKYSLLFDEKVKYGEDLLFNYKYVQNCDKPIAGNAQCLYFYRLHDEQATSNKQTRNARYLNDNINSCLANCIELKQYEGGVNFQISSIKKNYHHS